MRILYVTHGCPYPPNKGDRIRSFHILRHLASQHEVALIYPIFSPHDLQHDKELRPYCSTVDAIRLSPWLAKLRSLFGLFSASPLTVAHFFSPKIQRAVRNMVYDVLLIDCSSMAQYALETDTCKILDFVDVDYEKWQQYAEKAPFPLSLLYRIEYQRLKKFEIQASQTFDYCLVISPQERALLPDKTNVMIMPNGIDMERFHASNTHEKHVIVFVGAMDYFPNIDGVLYFHREIFPLVKQAVPDATFRIVGMNPPPKVQRLASADTIVTGYVPDVRDYVARAAVCVAPLRIAKGVQNKILEAMAMEVPVVATTAANQGINARDAQEICLADTPEAFAQAIVTLLQDARLRASLTSNAKQFIQNNFDWEHNLRKLDEVLALAVHKAR